MRRQVDRILRDGEGDIRRVIVAMATPAEDRSALIQTVAGALAQRSLAFSARDCLPVQRDVPQESVAMPRPMVRADRDAVRGSLSAQIADLGSADPAALRGRAMEHLSPLLSSGRIRRVVEQAAERTGADTSDRLWAASAVALDVPVGDLDRLLDEVEGIEGVYPNRRLRVPPVSPVRNFPPQVLENRASSWGVEGVGALATWGAYGARGAGSRVAVLDTGVDATHPDLVGKIAGFAEFDETGRQTGAAAYDGDRHGTHVCGTVAGGNSAGQWIGVAPEAQLFVGKVLGAHGGTDAQVLAGMTWAIEQQVDVISMSLGGLVLGAQTPPTYTNALVTALQHGMPVVAAIGNEGSQTTGLPGNDLFALSVGAIDYLDRAAGFSGGRTQIIEQSDYIDRALLPMPYSKPELSAPGVAVVSAVPGGSWEAFNGTSMATPHVSGVIALLLSATSIRASVRPQERAFIVQDLIVGSVDELGEAGQDHRFGFGKINALKAVGFARERGY